MSEAASRLSNSRSEAPRRELDSGSALSSFDFHPVDRMLFGAGRLAEVGEIARGLGFRRSLVVTDPGIVRAGHAPAAVDALRAAGVEIVLFDGVEENPTTAHVARALELARDHGIDSIVGVGGGSSMDCAKGVNFLYTQGGDMRDYWGVGKATKPMLPSIGIPTTAGTGSETQSFALISDPETHVKMACGDKKAAFRAVILDPLVTDSMPFDVLAATGLDAISHALESYVTNARNPISQAFSREAWRLLATNFDAVLSGGAGDEEHAGMLLGASLGGMSIENSMLGATHSLANPLTARFRIVHGVAIALMLPHVVRYNGACRDRDYAELTRLDETIDSSGIGGAELIARRVEAFREKARLPSRLSDCGVDEGCLPELAAEAARQWTAQFNPRPVSAEDLEELYRCAY